MLSAFIVTRDGAHLLPAAIANLRHYADEVVVVVDAASVDDSADVARQLADTTVTWETNGLPDAVRTRCVMELCHGDWLLMSDDDELWTPTFGMLLPGLLSGPAGEYAFTRRHIIADGTRWITSEPWWPDWQIRLRRKQAWQAFPWPELPHGVPVACSRSLVNVPFWHMKFIVQDVERRIARMNTWADAWQPAGGEHYRKFAMPEDFEWHTAPLDEDPPEELDAMLRACAKPVPPAVLG